MSLIVVISRLFIYDKYIIYYYVCFLNQFILLLNIKFQPLTSALANLFDQ